MTEVQSKKEPIDALNSEGGDLKTKASSEDQRMVDRMLGDVRKRYEDLDFTLEEKKVSHLSGLVSLGLSVTEQFHSSLVSVTSKQFSVLGLRTSVV